MNALLGFDVGGTKCAVSLGEPRGQDIEILAREAFPTPGGWRAALDAMTEAARKLLADSGRRAGALGISCGGPLDARRGLVQSPPNLPGWDNVPVVQILSDALGAPAYLENDANACALAEWRWGAGRGCEDMIFLTFGTGLGAGIIAGGRLLRGAGGNAGEVGHVRLTRYGPVGYGKAGAFEGFCSGGGIAQLSALRAEERAQSGLDPGCLAGGTALTLNRAAASGDALALALWEEVAERLGEGLAVLADVLNPERIVIGSIYARARPLLEPGMWRALRREALGVSLASLSVVPAELGERIGDFAALSVAANAGA